MVRADLFPVRACMPSAAGTVILFERLAAAAVRALHGYLCRTHCGRDSGAFSERFIPDAGDTGDRRHRIERADAGKAL